MSRASPESELLRLCDRYSATQSPIELGSFLSRLISRDQKLQLTTDVRNVIPTIASIKNGAMVDMLNRTVEGITPMHFVPDLRCMPKPPDALHRKTGRMHRHVAGPNKTSVNLPIREIFSLAQKTTRRSKSEKPRQSPSHRASLNEKVIAGMRRLPPLRETDDDIVPQLYVATEGAFYMCKHETVEDPSLKILPPAFPRHCIGGDYAVMTQRGVVTIADGHGDAADLGDHFKDKVSEFICERQEFRHKHSHRTFYTWIAKFKKRRFYKRVHAFDKLDEIAGPGFRNLVAKVNNYLVDSIPGTVVEKDKGPEAKVEATDFVYCQAVIDEYLSDVDRIVTMAASEGSRWLADFIFEIKTVSIIMKLNFDELEAIDSVPPSMKKYAVDLQYKTPSIHYDRMRDIEMQRQRELACGREDYLGKFFVRVNSVFSGRLVLKARDVLLAFLVKFDPTKCPERRIIKVLGLFDEKSGISVSPTKADFHQWINECTNRIKAIYLSESKQLRRDLIMEAVPGFNFEFEDMFVLIDRFKEIAVSMDIAFKNSAEAFDFYEHEMRVQGEFVKSLIRSCEAAEAFNEMRDMKKLEATIDNLLQIRQEMHTRPRLVFHKIVLHGEEITDFVLDMKPLWERSAKILDASMGSLRGRTLLELEAVFSEIQDKVTCETDGRIGRKTCSLIEAGMLMYALMALAVIKAWPDTMSDCRAGLETVAKMYGQLADKSLHTHNEAAGHFNEVMRVFGIQELSLPSREEEQEQVPEQEQL